MLPVVTLTWHASKYKVCKLHQRYILQRMPGESYRWWLGSSLLCSRDVSRAMFNSLVCWSIFQTERTVACSSDALFIVTVRPSTLALAFLLLFLFCFLLFLRWNCAVFHIVPCCVVLLLALIFVIVVVVGFSLFPSHIVHERIVCGR